MTLLELGYVSREFVARIEKQTAELSTLSLRIIRMYFLPSGTIQMVSNAASGLPPLKSSRERRRPADGGYDSGYRRGNRRRHAQRTNRDRTSVPDGPP
jgi:hypothetical protein